MPISTLLLLILSTLSFAWLMTLSIKDLISMISSSICRTDSMLVWASLLVSDATTANPFPASPARAASMDAFKDNRFVSSAISPIVLVISVISWDAWPTSSMADWSCLTESLMLCMAASTSCITAFPFWEMFTVSSILPLTPSPSALVSSTRAARVVALWAITFTERESWFTVEFISFIDWFCCFDAENICTDTSLLLSAWLCSIWETWSMETITPRMASIKTLTHRLIIPISSLLPSSLWMVKSPSVIVVIKSVNFFTGIITIWTIRSINRVKTSTDTIPKSIIIFLVWRRSL